MFPGGPGANAAYILPQAELVADHFSAYVIDPHGSGGSTPPADAADYGFEGHARFYDDVRRALELDRVSVYGFSFGGGVALAYAALFPGSTERCFSVSFGGGSEGIDVDEERERAISRHAGAPWYREARGALERSTELVLGARAGAEVDGMVRTMLPLYFAHPDRPEARLCIDRIRRMSRFNLAAIREWERGLYGPADLEPLLPRIAVPTVVVAGELDFVCTVTQARRIATAVPHARLVLIPECGHFPAEEAPETLHEVVAANS